MMLHVPEVSIIMPVYNRELYVEEAIESILKQTYQNFEFIIIDDCSTDQTLEKIKCFSDKRIKVLTLGENKGNYFARNLGIENARGKYICVMDSDDISTPTRIQQQYGFMENNTEYGICGGGVKIIDSTETMIPPSDYEEIKVWLMANIIFIHPTIFIRRDMINKYNLNYESNYRYSADYDFLAKASSHFPVTNLREIVLHYRRHPEQISTAFRRDQGKIADQVRLKQLKYFNIEPSPNNVRVHLALMNRLKLASSEDFKILQDWANYLVFKNNSSNYYNSLQLSLFVKSLLKVISKKMKSSSKHEIQLVN